MWIISNRNSSYQISKDFGELSANEILVRVGFEESLSEILVQVAAPTEKSLCEP